MKSNRRNFLKTAGSVLGALALCPAALIPEEKPKPLCIFGVMVVEMEGKQFRATSDIEMVFGDFKTIDLGKIINEQ